MFYKKESFVKIIKLFFLLCLGVWADFELSIPKSINVIQLESIVKNGWNDTNKTLNDLIVTTAKSIMPEILEKIEKPFEKKKNTKENYLLAPKINLARDDYKFIVAYSKYLEFNDDINKSLALNIDILKGIQNIEDTSLLSVIYSLVVEQIVREGLSQLLTAHKELKDTTLFRNILSLLTLDTRAFFIAMKRERDVLLNIDLYRNVKEKYLAQEVGKNYKFLMEDVHHYIVVYQNDFYQKMFAVMKKETAEAMSVYENEMQKMKKEHLSTINHLHFTVSALWIKIQSTLGIEVKNFGYVSQYIAHNLVYVATPKINEIYIDYLEHIQKNKIFLKQLKKFSN